ncbi:DUF2933 domain-containing protein [Massilia sp. WF1]|uniref:DUF2933 domain-containing protein n=1 Tax=Massilia sp. WF1 TaxID=1406431 RepID=UPI0035A3B45E
MSAITGLLYISVPEIRSLILTAAPTLVFLLCPISMFLGMRLMGGKGGESREAEQQKLPLWCLLTSASRPWVNLSGKPAWASLLSH